jgi:hypothetical protein
MNFETNAPKEFGFLILLQIYIFNGTTSIKNEYMNSKGDL